MHLLCFEAEEPDRVSDNNDAEAGGEGGVGGAGQDDGETVRESNIRWTSEVTGLLLEKKKQMIDNARMEIFTSIPAANEIFQRLMRTTNDELDTPLHLACRNNNLELVGNIVCKSKKSKNFAIFI